MRILSHFRKFLRGHLWSAAAPLPLLRLRHAAAEKVEANRAEKFTGSTVTSARPVLSGRRFSAALWEMMDFALRIDRTGELEIAPGHPGQWFAVMLAP
ncbi:MAG: hypothetical protein WCE61_13425 [Candidatus Acidiferrum sp.]